MNAVNTFKIGGYYQIRIILLCRKSSKLCQLIIIVWVNVLLMEYCAIVAIGWQLLYTLELRSPKINIRHKYC